MPISNENIIIADSALHAFEGDPSYYRYRDDHDVSIVDMLFAKDTPCEGATSYSTLGLSDHSIDLTVDELPLRVEIVGACATYYEQFPNIMVSCARRIIDSSFSIFHGVVMPDMIEMYYPDIAMKHVLFLSPFLWDRLRTLEFPTKTVAWLLVIPISENEYRFAQEQGVEQLEDLFEEKQIDILDLERPSIL